MSDLFLHEKRYRSASLMEILTKTRITICGAGALGANMADSLARSGCVHLKVIDRDRIEAQNLSTQPYHANDLGAFKAKILANQLYRAVGARVEGICLELGADNAKNLFKGSELIIDVFDNSGSRQLVKDTANKLGIPCLHAGLGDAYGEVVWNRDYRVPSATNDDICDYPLARNLVVLTVAVACETVLRYLDHGLMHNHTITLQDFAVRNYS
jgi:molybdopterin/thiamine biosynthesis adenylyltransferase